MFNTNLIFELKISLKFSSKINLNLYFLIIILVTLIMIYQFTNFIFVFYKIFFNNFEVLIIK